MEPILLFVLPLISLVAFLGWRYITSRSRSSKQHDSNEKGSLEEKDPYQAIEPLPDFDWKTTPPIKNAPLKPIYHLTMALENIPLSCLIDMDNTYLTRLHTRREIMTTHPAATIACTTPCIPAVHELYTWLINTYLPKRFPTIYKPTPTGDLYNTASDEIIPGTPPLNKPLEALRILGSHIDTDFLLLLPSSRNAKDGSPIYHLEAFVTCFPSGFSTRAKLSRPLAEIHAPVPGYTAKLEKSMDRFFARIEVGRCVKRMRGGNHLYESGSTDYDAPRPTHDDDDEAKDALTPKATIAAQKASVHIPSCRLRSERQTLFRLPETKALVFAFKTYQYRLEDVKEFGEGYAERLVEAMEGLGKGNVPEMEFYKRGVVWRERVVEFLRS